MPDMNENAETQEEPKKNHWYEMYELECLKTKVLEAQIEKMSKTLLDLLWFEDNLDPYMYECDDAQQGELLKPFNKAKELLKKYECKKCNGKGIVFTKKYHNKITCPVCNGEGFIFNKEIKEK